MCGLIIYSLQRPFWMVISYVIYKEGIMSVHTFSFRFNKIVIFLALGLGVLASITAQALEIDGRPGQFVMQSALIDANNDNCYAMYPSPYMGNIVISNSGWGDPARIRISSNKNMVNVQCKFIDVSGVYETNAEVGDIINCRLLTDMGQYTDGVGKVVAAANNGSNDGGNVTLHCRFDATSFIPNP
jgi:hypothetical protein